MEVSVPYAGRKLEFDVPKGNLLALVVPRLPRAGNEVKTIGHALANPIDSKRVSQLARPESKVAIAVTDSTRQVPNHTILPSVIRELEESGVKDQNVTIVVATGMHRPSAEEEIRSNVGDEVARRFKVVNHNAEDEAAMTRYGKSQLGTELLVNRVFGDADLKIVTGTITPCSLSGWCGGSKTLMPGVSGRRSIEQNHALFVKNLSGVNRGAMGGIGENNLVRKDMDDCARMAGLDYAVNVSLNEEKQVMQAFAGAPQGVHKAGVQFGKDVMKTSLPERADIVVAGPGYVENEVSLFQSATRAFATVENLVKERGTIILVSSCHKGLYEGTSEEVESFRKWLVDLPKAKEIMELTERKEIPSFEACVLYQFSWMMQRSSVKVITSGVSEDALDEIGIGRYASANEAIEESLRVYGKEAKIAVVPYASITYVSPIPAWDVASLR